MPVLPNDTNSNDWLLDNLTMWNQCDLLRPQGYEGLLSPLEAKALHVIGLLVQTYNAASHLLYVGGQGPCANYYLHAYLLACSAIELLAHCKNGDEDLIKVSAHTALEQGFLYITTLPIKTNEEQYDACKLVALRNLAAHGQGVASVRHKIIPVFLHVELLDNFPEYLSEAFDSYYCDLFKSINPSARKKLAKTGVEPVLYAAGRSGQAFRSPIRFAYEEICLLDKKPSDMMECKDWQVYK